MRVAWMALLLLTGGLAGCIGTVDDEQASAMELLDQARSQASEHGEAPELTFVFGVELDGEVFENVTEEQRRSARQNASEGDLFEGLFVGPDPTIGDGRALAWLYTFDLPGNQSYGVTVAANGTVLAEDLYEEDTHEQGITGWEVDSDEAAEIAEENNATWAQRASQGSTFLALGQSEDEEDPAWGLGLEGPDGSDELIVAVNATTGEYLGATDLDFGPFNVSIQLPPPTESGMFEGELTLVEPTIEHTWQVEEAGHSILLVTLQVDLPAPATEVGMTVTGPDGSENATVAATMDQDTVQLQLEDPATGSWTAQLDLADGLAQRYWVGWCAPGFLVIPPFGADRPSPCQEQT